MKGRRLLAAIVIEPRNSVAYLRVAARVQDLGEIRFQLFRQALAVGESSARFNLAQCTGSAFQC